MAVRDSLNSHLMDMDDVSEFIFIGVSSSSFKVLLAAVYIASPSDGLTIHSFLNKLNNVLSRQKFDEVTICDDFNLKKTWTNEPLQFTAINIVASGIKSATQCLLESCAVLDLHQQVPNIRHQGLLSLTTLRFIYIFNSRGLPEAHLPV